MALINISLNAVAYADQQASFNPNMKYVDFRWSLLGLPTDVPRTVPIKLSPNEIAVVMTTQRTLTYTTSSTFVVSNVTGTSFAKLSGPLGARGPRNSGDGTTQWAITLTNTLVTLTWTGTGTAPDFTTMVAGDEITIDTPFNPLNQGDYVIVKVGVNYVQFTNGIAQPETVIGNVDIYTSGPVRVGDTLDLVSTQLSYPNRGEFTITRVTDSFIEFSNPDAIPETVTTVQTTDINIYPEAHQWMLLAVDGKVVVRLNNDTGNGVIVEPIAPGDIVNNPGLFLKRGKVFRVDLINPGLQEVNGTMFLAG